jgi:hypothetical protein
MKERNKMKVEQLLGVNFFKHQDLNEDEFKLKSIFCNKELPKKGITLAKNMAAYESSLKDIKQSKIPTDSAIQVYVIDYMGNRVARGSSARMGWDDVKQSDFIRLSELSSEVYEVIHELVWSWVDSVSAKNPQFEAELRSNGHYKQTQQGIRPKLTSTRLIIADYPILIDNIHKLPQFNHLDAIAYQVRLDGQMEEFITIFKNNSLLLDDAAKSQKHIRANLSNYKGYLVLPASVSKGQTLRTLSQWKEIENQAAQHNEAKRA